ncbi:MAG TPA: aspartate kinase [Saprospiraceae bacterium]|jgi:aspartate kinase|nr:aspartate kinase [Saprospiraceae bacterium]HMT70493.1 aspartate kinase [Saprospiraceae bacterium]
MELKVFKFGGASVRDAEGFKNVGQIMSTFKQGKIVLVVSAMGKTTNALEAVVKSYYAQDGRAYSLLDDVKQAHIALITDLFADGQAVIDDINDVFVEIEWILEEVPHEDFDYTYDQIVSMGELLSSKILGHYLTTLKLQSQWLDVRDVIATDNTFRDARIIWDSTQKNAISKINPLLENHQIIVTQGFIGSTSENFTTTLGREGSDYTAAILSYCLDAESMHIWKDVPGVLTGDPRIFEEVIMMPRLSYKEAIEMTYYGAKVIHPKTIKPIQNKQIPLYVRPFLDPSSEGTIISDEKELSYPPVVVIEMDQTLLHISTNDFSFVAEHHLSMIFSLLAKYRLKVNMMRNTAISFTVCVNNIPDRIKKFESELGAEFKMITDNDLELITIRHYNEDILKDMKKNKLILFEERLSDTVQMVVRNLPKMKRKETNH